MSTPDVEDGKVTPGVEDGMVSPGVEDGMVTPGVEDGKVTPGVEVGMVTPCASEEPKSAGFTTLGSTRAKGVTVIHVKHWSTLKSTVYAQEESQKTTASNAATDHSKKLGGEAPSMVQNDGLAIVTLDGIIVGILLSVGCIGGIIIEAVGKKLGRN